MTELDPFAFLRATPPFERVPQADFEAAVRSLQIRLFPAGARLLRRGDSPFEALYVIRKGAVRLERDGQTVLVLEEGEVVGLSSLLARTTPFDVVVHEDMLAYVLPRAAVEPLLAHRRFSAYFADELGERLRNSLEDSPTASYRADLGAPVSTLLRRPLLEVAPTTTVLTVARTMRAAGVSAVIVSGADGAGPGIVTDRDLRDRVLAEGRGAEIAVREVASTPLRTIAAETPVYEAWQVLIDSGVHHLPVTREGRLIGMVTGTDLLKHGAQGPIAMLRHIERLGDRAHLPGYATRLTEMVSGLVAGGIEATVIAGFVARLNDALTARLLRWAEEELGPPPAPYAWLVLGSEGRREQTLLTDEDNALVWADREGAAPYFAELAARVVDDLGAAGFPPCPGGVMATRWQGPLAEWKRRFRDWLDAPSAQVLLEAATFFDFRRAGGTLELAPLEELVGQARQRPLFIRGLAEAALALRPPAALFLRLRGDSSRADLKQQGLAPVVMLARCQALEVGSPARTTLDRLAAAARGGLLDDETLGSLSESYRFLLRLRLREQLRALARSEAPSSKVSMGDLHAAERRALKEAFRVIREWQDAAAEHYQADLR